MIRKVRTFKIHLLTRFMKTLKTKAFFTYFFAINFFIVNPAVYQYWSKWKVKISTNWGKSQNVKYSGWFCFIWWRKSAGGDNRKWKSPSTLCLLSKMIHWKGRICIGLFRTFIKELLLIQVGNSEWQQEQKIFCCCKYIPVLSAPFHWRRSSTTIMVKSHDFVFFTYNLPFCAWWIKPCTLWTFETMKDL